MRTNEMEHLSSSSMLVAWSLLVLFLAMLPSSAVAAKLSVIQAPAGQPAISLTPNQGIAGGKVTLLGSGFRGGEKISLLWETVEGMVKVDRGYMYGGHEFRNVTRVLSKSVTDNQGSITLNFVIPYDYGGYHQVVAQGSEGSTASFTFYMLPSLSMTPSGGPAGTKIVFTGNGFGWTVGLDDAWQVNYDNKYLGYFVAIGSKGNVTFGIHASGDTGIHTVDVQVNPYGPTYLNLQEAFPEFARLPRFHFNFDLTQSQAREPASEVSYDLRPSAPLTQTSSATSISVEPGAGAVGTMLKITGAGFGPSENVNVSWTSVVGAYISPTGFMNTSIPIYSSKTDSTGHFAATFKVPYDVGGFHTIQVKGSAGSSANSTFYVARSAEISPTSGPLGTTVTIHVYGVGWKSWENIVAIDYDNGYMGYACALGSQPGNITIIMKAIGSPGLHVIDLYPSIFRGPPTVNYRSIGGQEPDVYRFPLLTPNELPQPIPIFHFEFIITGAAPSGVTDFGVLYVILLIPIVAAAAFIVFRKLRPPEELER